MRRALRAAAALAALLLSFAAAAQVPQALRAALAQSNLAEDDIAFALRPLDGGFGAREHQGGRAMAPASTMKLVTTMAALELLGPNWRGRTELRIDGRVRGGTLHGNVHLRGFADADLGVPALLELLHALRQQGIRRIAGDIVLDRGHFTPARSDIGLPPFDEGPEWQYNVVPDALHLAGSVLRVRLVADAHRLTVRTEPRLWGIDVRHAMTLVDGECRRWDDAWLPPEVRVTKKRRVQVLLRGIFPRGCQRLAELQLFDRDLLANRILRQLWADLGGALDGRVRPGTTPEGARLAGQHASRPLAEIIRHMNKASDNAETRLLHLAIGAQAPAELRAAHATTQAAANARIGEWIAAQGIATDGLVLDNGSGLSRSERIAPRQLAALLRAAADKQWAPEFIASLPLVGVDGTMRNRLKDSPAAARARVKTGTLRDVDANAGYVRDTSGRMWVFSAMLRHDPGIKARPVLDALIDWIARGTPDDAPVPGAPAP